MIPNDAATTAVDCQNNLINTSIQILTDYCQDDIRNNMKKFPVGIRLTKELKDRLRKAARIVGLTMQAILERGLELALREIEKER